MPKPKTSKKLSKKISKKKTKQTEDVNIDDSNSGSEIESEIDNSVFDTGDIKDINTESVLDDIENVDNENAEIELKPIDYFNENIECVNHDYNKKNIIVDKDKRITNPFLTKYEYIRCLCERTKQIELGAKVMIKNANELQKIKTSKELAEYEIKVTKSCPLIIVRALPNGTEEHWDINELEILFN